MPNWKPQSYNSVSPYLICKDAESVIEFVQVVFAGELVRRFNRPDGSLMHAELKIDDTIVMLGSSATAEQQLAPHIHVYVPDAEAAYKRALDYGASAVQEPLRKTPDDDLRGGVRDGCGNTWWLATQ